jgi:DNA-binding helix-hairpin-helix protein with protein kinase domain
VGARENKAVQAVIMADPVPTVTKERSPHEAQPRVYPIPSQLRRALEFAKFLVFKN